MKKILEKYKWYVPPSIFLFMALYDWLILAELNPNKFYGSFILFIIVYFYTTVENKKNVANSDNDTN